MQKNILLLLLATTFLGCNSFSKKSEEIEEKKVLTVTIEPQRYFLDQIVGDNFTINTLVPPGTSPETYEPAPSVIVDMANSSLYFKVGDLGFEKAWSSRMGDINPNVGIVDCSVGIELMEGHEHNHDHNHNHAEGHNHGALDPHVWSSPSAIKIFAENMLDAVISIDRENEDEYLANFTNFINRVDSVDRVIREYLENAPKSFIIYHPALGYFAQDYDLHQHSIEFEGKNPSPVQIKQLVDLAKKEIITTVFVQKGFDVKNGEVIAKEIDADVFEIDPLSYDWGKELIRIASIIGRDK